MMIGISILKCHLIMKINELERNEGRALIAKSSSLLHFLCLLNRIIVPLLEKNYVHKPESLFVYHTPAQTSLT